MASIASTSPMRSIFTPSGRPENSRVGGGGVQHHEHAAVVGAADQAAEGLGDAGPRDSVVIGLAAEAAAASLV